MTQTFSKARQQAEISFAQIQSKVLPRERAVDELDAIAQARKEKTLGLKMARLAKELENRARATTATAT